MEKKRKFNLYDIGMIILIIVSLFSTSKFGVSLSWIMIPAGCIAAGACMGKIKFSDTHLYSVLFYVIAVISTLVSTIVRPQRDVLSFFLLVGLFIIVTGNVESKEKGMMYIKTYILVGLAGALVILFNFATGNYYHEYYQRSTIVVMDIARDPNVVGAFIAPVPALMLIFRPIKNKPINIFLVFLVFAGLIVCGSRGAIVSALLPMIFYFFFKIKGMSRKIGTFIILIFVIFIGLKFAQEFLPQQTIDRLLLQNEGADNRSEIWKIAIKAFLDSPIIGQGISSANYYAAFGIGHVSHNFYIEILSTSGIIGTLMYLLILIKSTLGQRRNMANMFILAIPFYLPQLFINGFNTMTMWLPIFMIHYCKCYLDKQADKQQEI